MKLQQALSVLSLAAFAAAGDFYATCRIDDIQENRVMTAKCAGSRGKLHNFLDLDQCYGVNADGNLIPLENGNYTGRCQLCSITYDGKMMCQCLDGDDKTVKTTIDLNDIISNDDGILHCHVGAGVDASCFQQGMWDDECP